MSAWRRFLRRVGGPLRWRRAESELDLELQSHLEMETAALIKSGLAPDEARAAARRKFGAVDRFAEECRDERGGQFFEAVVSDARYALRTARRSPGFTATVVLTLGLAIGANTAMFTVVNAVLLRPLPFQRSNEVVAVYAQNPDRSLPRFNASYADFMDWRRDTRTFAGMSAYSSSTMTFAGDGEPERLSGLVVTSDFFSVLGVTPALGRLFGADDENGEASGSIVLSHGFWQRRFGGDSAIVGRALQFTGRTRTVIGVLPKDFILDGRAIDAVSVLAPSSIPGVENHGQHMVQVAGRLKPGVTLDDARKDLGAVATRLAETYPDIKGWSTNVFGFRDEVVRGTSQPLMILSAAAVLVLLIGCINIANLLIARGASRGHEVGLRRALGASRGRLVSQLLVESAVLALIGGALGVAIASVATRFMLRLVPQGTIPRLEDVRLDIPVFLFALALSVVTALVVGLWPAFRATGTSSANVSLRDGGRTSTGGSAAAKFRRTLVVAEVALALVLVMCAGLVLQSLQRTLKVNPGFSADHVVTMRLTLNPASYPDSAQAPFYRELLGRLLARPGIEGAAAGNTPPISGGGIVTGIRLMGRAAAPDAKIMTPATAVTPGYFQTMGMKVLKGRDISWMDPQATLVVSEAAARRLWPSEDPIGKRIAFGNRDNTGLEVVGLVSDAHARGLRTDPTPMVYMAYSSASSITRTMSLVVRGPGGSATLVSTIRSVLKELDASLPVFNVQMVQEVIDQSVAQPRLNTTLLAVFAGIALVLAGIGVYGVVSYSVAQRTQELGVRMALGASQTDVFRLILREGTVLAAIGVALGVVGTFAATPLIQSWLFGIGRNDLMTFAVTSGVVLLLALAASYLPARRATTVDPVLAMRGGQ